MLKTIVLAMSFAIWPRHGLSSARRHDAGADGSADVYLPDAFCRFAWGVGGPPHSSNLGLARTGLVASIRERMDAPTLMPDGPPLSPGEAASFRLHFADGVEGKRTAIYEQSERS
jgi:hypothetical protein